MSDLPVEYIATGAAVAISVLVTAMCFFRRKSNKVADAPVALNERQYQNFPLVSKQNINHNTVLLRFELPSSKHRVGLPVGKHMFLRFKDAEGNPISRPYTPVSSDDQLGYFDLLIKLYDQGKMSQHLKKMQVGDSIECRGPSGSLAYKGRGHFSIVRKNPQTNEIETLERKVKHIAMIAGGSGITPMLQIVRDVCKNAATDKTKISLIFANVTEEDILLREELDNYAKTFPQFKLFYTLDKPGPNWKYGSGYVTADMIKEQLPAPANDVEVLLCGPPPMIEFMEKNLVKLNYSVDTYFKY